MRNFTVAAIIALISLAVPVWAQHDHGGHGMPAEVPRSPEAAAKEARDERTRQVSKLQEKIDYLDSELERTDLKPAKRKKLEAKLKKLLDKKNKLLDDGQTTSDEEHRGHGQHQH